MSSVVISGDTSGAITLQAPAVAGSTTLNLPASSGTVLTQNSSAPANSFVVDASGNVGIGTSSPAEKLNVSGGNIRTTNTTGTSFYRADNTSGQVFVGIDSSTASTFGVGNYSRVLWSSGAYPLVITTNDTERMRIDSSGQVLINTTSNITSGGSVTNLTVKMTNTGGVGGLFQVAQDGNWAVGFQNSSGTNAGKISVSGTTTTYSTSSDYRLKENVKPMTGALDVVAKLNPVTYTWIESKKEANGFIAHELQSVLPDAVDGVKDEVYEDGTPKYQGIDTSFLVATLTKAIQELKAIVDEQAEKIKALEAK